MLSKKALEREQKLDALVASDGRPEYGTPEYVTYRACRGQIFHSLHGHPEEMKKDGAAQSLAILEEQARNQEEEKHHKRQEEEEMEKEAI